MPPPRPRCRRAENRSRADRPTFTRRPSCRKAPSARTTVLPGQFPVCWRSPVSALKTVVLPTLGLPASAIRWSQRCGLSPRRTRFRARCRGAPAAATAASLGPAAPDPRLGPHEARSSDRRRLRSPGCGAACSRRSAINAPLMSYATGSPAALFIRACTSVPGTTPRSRRRRLAGPRHTGEIAATVADSPGGTSASVRDHPGIGHVGGQAPR